MRSQNLDRAQELLSSLPPALPDHILASVADLHMAMERWSEAADVLARMKYRNSSAEMNRKLCGNLASFKQHRPAIYKTLIETRPGDRFAIAPSKTGHPTIFVGPTSLSAGNDPLGGVQTAMNTIDAAYRAGKAIGLTGIGDGYLLSHLAQNPPELILGREQAIVIIEPDPNLLLAVLVIHDFSGADGPIEQSRFNWYVGLEWAQSFRDEFFSDLFRMYPNITIRTGLSSDAIEEELAKFLKEVAALDTRLVEEIQAHYARMTTEDWLDVLGEHPKRQPRVLVITTRFSTVLQYSAGDTTDAFRRLGWDAHLLIEPGAAHGMNRIAIRDAVARVKPDLVFQIDHIRSEYGNMFPPNLPAICWIQDHLPNLMNAQAGVSIGPRDFILTADEQMYHGKFGYPLRQCIYLNKATRVPQVPAAFEQDGETMVFVSNCSHEPGEMVEKLAQKLAGEPTELLVREFCRRAMEHYAGGGCIESIRQLREALMQVEGDLKIHISSAEHREKLVHALWHPFNDTLYRQQALRWAADAADSMGLTLALYGNGWEKNREFARFARGYAKYGAELEELTRRSRINLQIVPFSCFHQRLLDGLVSGGFFLIREHPVNHIPADFTAFVETNFDPSIRTTDAARKIVSDELRPRFEELLAAYRRLNDQPDPVLRVRTFKERSMLQKLPRLDEVCFGDEATLRERLIRFADDRDARREVSANQKEFVERAFTYEAHMRRVVREIHSLISLEPQQISKAA